METLATLYNNNKNYISEEFKDNSKITRRIQYRRETMMKEKNGNIKQSLRRKQEEDIKLVETQMKMKSRIITETRFRYIRYADN
jgi:hypothetical protein